ncbi:MAG: sulfatase [Candidatus Hydrogenedentes bacterium]|nr:sulfatase [Candidatus Hydrogenedentota bacterium]
MRVLFVSLCAVVVGLSISVNSHAASSQPNILFILADDMGWSAPACYGSDLHETPNIDRLATQGVRFTQAYSASPVCTPTRAAIMTGQHPARLNITIWHEAAVSRLSGPGDEKLAPPITETALALEHTTLAEVLHDAGYQTAHVGKWHLGTAEQYPETQGFDVNVGGTFYGAPLTYWYPYKGERVSGGGVREFRYVPGLPPGKEGDYLEDKLTDQALTLMEQMHASGKPFYLNMAFYSPHTPIEGKPELVAKYKAKIREGMTHRNAGFAAMMETLDENIGRLLDKLDTLGIADNTVVVFYSDNGGFDEVRNGEQVANNSPLRSGKGSAYEGGIRVPLIVRWPGVTPAGAVCDTPVTSMDFYPTILEMLGDKAPAPGKVLDGVSLGPLLRDPAAALGRKDFQWHYPHYYFNTTPVSAFRHGDWKLIEYYEDGRKELYNIKDDLSETTDLAAANPEIVKDLEARLQAWRTEVNARLPEKNVP